MLSNPHQLVSLADAAPVLPLPNTDDYEGGVIEGPRVYISGPMSGYVDHNFPVFFRAEALAYGLGWSIENPARHGVQPGWQWCDYIQRDLEILRNCHAIAMLRNWEESPGAQIELLASRRMGLAVFSLDQDDLVGTKRDDGIIDLTVDEFRKLASPPPNLPIRG